MNALAAFEWPSGTMRCFTRLTNGFSKKVENHRVVVALHFTHYNSVRAQSTIRCTLAMTADVSKHLWSMEELID